MQSRETSVLTWRRPLREQPRCWAIFQERPQWSIEGLSVLQVLTNLAPLWRKWGAHILRDRDNLLLCRLRRIWAPRCKREQHTAPDLSLSENDISCGKQQLLFHIFRLMHILRLVAMAAKNCECMQGAVKGQLPEKLLGEQHVASN